MAKNGRRIAFVWLEDQKRDMGRQTVNLDPYGPFDRVFVEQENKDVAGTLNWPSLEERERLMEYIRPGDVVFVNCFSCWSANSIDLVSTLDRLREKDVDIVFIEPALDTRTEEGRRILRLVRSLVSLDADYGSRRRKAGLKKAKEEGRPLGRPRAPLPENFSQLCLAWAERRMTAQEICAKCNMKLSTFYSRARRLGFYPQRASKDEKKREKAGKED